MGWLTLLGISLGLALDAFAVAIAAGLTLQSVTPRQVFRLGFHFGLFQFLMPVVGWLAGKQVAACLGAWDHWAAFGLLSYVGGKMLWEARSDSQDTRSRTDPTRGLVLVTLSLATSIDALAVGLSMGLLGISIWVPSVVIGLVAGLLTTLGMCFGTRLGRGWGRRAEFLGGCVLVLIGVRILILHLVA